MSDHPLSIERLLDERLGIRGALLKTDTDPMKGWVKNSCHNYPSEDIHDVATALIKVLAKHPGEPVVTRGAAAAEPAW